MAKTMKPVVVDLSHHNEVEDFAAVYQAGIRGVIHKATQGSSFVDMKFAGRRTAAKKAGLLFGCYHFIDGTDVEKQAAHFLDVAKPDSATLLCLDWEPNGSNTASLDQAKQFLKIIYNKTGQRPVLYSGSLIKDTLKKKADPFLSQHRLWLAQYGPKAKLPAGFKSYWLWQYTGDGTGLQPHSVPGIKGSGIDLNVYSGKDLIADWVHVNVPPAADYIPERAGTKVSDLKGKSAIIDAALKLRNAGLVTAGSGIAVGVGNETAPPVVQPADPSILSVDGLAHAAEKVSTVHAIADTANTTWHILSQNGWLLGVAAGFGIVIFANSIAGKALEEYVLGLLHLKET